MTSATRAGRSASARSKAARRGKTPRRRTVVLKLGGELLDDHRRLLGVARLIARASRHVPLVVVHGGGKEIDAALAQAGIPKQQVDGLRITDANTLQVVVAVLAGSINTRLVAAVNGAGGRAVGLTGADAGVGLVEPARPHRAATGELVGLGLVGEPRRRGRAPLIEVLSASSYVPVVACIGRSRDGRLFNVNADTLAGSLAERLGATRLIVAGGTAGVLDGGGHTLPTLDGPSVDGLIASGTATVGMVAKLRACRQAVEGGVDDVRIADGRQPELLTTVLRGAGPRRGAWTQLAPLAMGTRARTKTRHD